MKSHLNFINELSGSEIHPQVLEFFKAKFNSFYKANKEVIDDYLYFKEKIEELEYRLNIHYKLTVSSSKTSGKVINAMVKMPFASTGSRKSKYPFFNIHIAKLSDFKGGLSDPSLKDFALKKIRDYIDAKYPFTILGADNQSYILYFTQGK